MICLIYIFSKYAWVVPLKDEKDVTISDTFQKILNKSGPKPWVKIWVNKCSSFYKKLLKSWLQSNIEMYSMHNEEKSVRNLFKICPKIY